MSLQTLNENLDIIQNLVIPFLADDLDNIQKLDDEPNDVGGLTAAELKAEFDKAGNTIKEYLNETLIPQLSDTVAEAEVRATAERERVANENIRISNENTRISNENTRISNENTRIENENTRIENEDARQENETARVNAEKARADAESARVREEQARVDRDTGIVAQATAQANAAKASAEQAATSVGAAAKSETNAKTSETNAKTSEGKAKTSETNAGVAQAAAAQSAIAAVQNATRAEKAQAAAEQARDEAQAVAKRVEVMTVTVTGSSANGFAADKTLSEIKAHVDSGGAVIAQRGGFQFAFYGMTANAALFYAVRRNLVYTVEVYKNGATFETTTFAEDDYVAQLYESHDILSTRVSNNERTIVQINGSSSDGYTASTTTTAIYAAWSGGSPVYAKVNDDSTVYHPDKISATGCSFSSFFEFDGVLYRTEYVISSTGNVTKSTQTVRAPNAEEASF